MQAAVLDGPARPFEVREVELDQPHAGEVLVRVAASGLCGSDLKALDGLRSLVPFPVILGHEAAGVVQAIGEGVERLSPGDHGVLSILPSCGRCASCRRGRPNHCMTTATAMRGGNLLDGSSRLNQSGLRINHFLTVSSFAEYAVVPESAAMVIDSAMPLDCAALLGCAVLTGYGAVRNSAGVEPGARVAVLGCGGVGLSAVQGARIAGAETIVAVDVQPAKLALARALGATDTVDPSETDPVAAVREATDGGADYVFEAAGRSEAIEQAWASLAVGGLLTVIGTLATGTKLTLAADPLIEEKRIAGCGPGPRRAKWWCSHRERSRMSPEPMDHPAGGDAPGLTRAELLRRAAGGAMVLSADGLLAACGSSGSSASTPSSGSVGTGKAKAGGHLRIGATGGGAKDSIDAHLATADTDIVHVSALYEPLAQPSADFKSIEMVLAESIEPYKGDAEAALGQVAGRAE